MLAAGFLRACWAAPARLPRETALPESASFVYARVPPQAYYTMEKLKGEEVEREWKEEGGDDDGDGSGGGADGAGSGGGGGGRGGGRGGCGNAGLGVGILGRASPPRSPAAGSSFTTVRTRDRARG